jgi:DNA primase
MRTAGSPDTIDEVKQRIDVVEVVGSYVPDLKKAGRNYKARCPFHQEKTPSFYVFPDRQSWHCFGACSMGGDAFSFVMKREGIGFGEALRILADRAGVPLTFRSEHEGETEADKLKGMNEAAAEYYHHLLRRSPVGEKARAYLAGRGILDKTIGQFQLGYSPDSWDSLRQEMLRRGYREGELAAAGLLIQKERREGTYDRFRNRLVFPIRDMNGSVLGFGARALEDSLPKYLNSPQTLIFDKSSVLYGIDQAKSAIRKQDSVVVVEGYVDAIVAHHYGFSNVVASLGTALTEKQVAMIKKLTKNLVLALDADAAGEMATLRGIEVASHTFDQRVIPLLTPAGLVKYEGVLDAEIKVMVLPAGRDPDEVIKNDPGEWERLLGEASPVVDYTFELVVSRVDPKKMQDKSSAVDRLLPLIAGIKHPVRQAHYLQRLARVVGLDERSLASAIKQLRLQAVDSRRESGPARPSRMVSSLSQSDPLAEYCLFLLISHAELRNHASGLSADFFAGHSENRELFLAWQQSDDLESMRQGLDVALLEHLEAILAKPVPPLCGQELEHAVAECVRRLRERWLREMKTREKILLSESETEASTADLEEVQQSAVKLNTELGEVFLHAKQKKGQRPG